MWDPSIFIPPKPRRKRGGKRTLRLIFNITVRPFVDKADAILQRVKSDAPRIV